MIRSFRKSQPGLQLLWKLGKDLALKTILAEQILDVLYVVNSSNAPQDAAFTGFRYDEWVEGEDKRHGIMISDHWLISFGWSDGHAIDVDLERID